MKLRFNNAFYIAWFRQVLIGVKNFVYPEITINLSIGNTRVGLFVVSESWTKFQNLYGNGLFHMLNFTSLKNTFSFRGIDINFVEFLNAQSPNSTYYQH